MHRSVVLFVALRYTLGQSIDNLGKYIYWIVSISIMLGVMATIIVLSVMNGFERELKKNILNFIPHALLTTSKGYVYTEYKPKFILNKLRNIMRVQPLVTSKVILQSSGKIELGSMLGVDPNNFEPLFSYLINKRAKQLVAGEYYIIIGLELAKKLDVHINDHIRVTIPSIMQITPIGYIPIQRLFTVLDIYITASEVDAYQVIVHQSDAAVLMQYPLQCVTGWRMWMDDPFLVGSKGGGYDYDKLKLPRNWIWKDWREYKGSLFQAVKIEKNIMSLLLGLIIIAAGFNIISFLILLIFEKKIEIAVLQTYGFTRWKIMLVFVIQGICNGTIGIVLGTGLGVLLSNKLNRVLLFFKIFPDTFQFPVEIRSFQILGIIFVTFVIVLLAALYTAYRATDFYPARVLRND